MRRALKWLGGIAGVLIAIPLLLLAAANTNPGRRSMERVTAWASHGSVRLAGLSGRFPDNIRIRSVTVADPAGPWLTVDDAALIWSPTRLLLGDVSVDLLAARQATLDRLPAATSGTSNGMSMPSLRLTVSRLRLGRLEIGAAVAGHPAALAVEGSGGIDAHDSGTVHLAVTASRPSLAQVGGLDHDAQDGRAPDAEPPEPDRYTVEAAFDPAHIHAVLAVTEGARGLIAGLLQLPDLGATTIGASIDGPTDALATKVTIEAGPLQSHLDGSVDLVSRAADLAVSLTAPAMTPGPGVGWSSIRLAGNIHGPFADPKASGTLTADHLTVAGAAITSLRADIAGGPAGETTLHARVDGLRVPGPSPDVLSGGPVTLDAITRLGEAGRPVRFTVKHVLFSAEGTAETAGVEQAEVTLTLPDLAPLAAIEGANLAGHAAVTVNATRSNGAIELAAKGSVGIADGPQSVPALVGNSGTFDLAASVRGDNIRLSHLSLNGSAFNASASGKFVDRRTDLDWSGSVTDLGVFRPGLSGSISGHGHVEGSPTALALNADVTGNVTGPAGRLDQLAAHLDIDGLPDAPAARLNASGMLLNAPLDLAIDATRGDDGFHLVIDHAAWKSLTAGGTLDLAPGATLPVGKITVAMPNLGDLTPLVGRPVTGGVTASLEASPEVMHIGAIVVRAGVPGTAAVARTTLDATVTDPGGRPSIDGTLTVDGADAGGVRASGRLIGKGPVDGVALTLAAEIADPGGAPAHVETSGTLNAGARTLALTSFQGDWRRQTIRLLAPARIAFAPGVAVDQLRLGLRQGEMTIAGSFGRGNFAATSADLPIGHSGPEPSKTVARRAGTGPVTPARGTTTRRAGPGSEPGRASPGRPGTERGGAVPGPDMLDVHATIQNLPADLIAAVAPAYTADGTISGDARLTGTLTRPEGTIHVRASRLRMRTGPGQALPAGDVTLGAMLDGMRARLDGGITMGGSTVTLSGLAPLELAGPLNIHVGGAIDLALLNPLLTAQGRNVRGRVALAFDVGGTPVSPKANGTVALSGGEFQDISMGAHLSAITALVSAEGDTIRLDRFGGTAGPGTVSGDGTMTFAGGFSGLPAVALNLRASNARLLSSDLATALIDANLVLRGPLGQPGAGDGALNQGEPTLSGTLLVRRADIRVPEQLPPSIAVLPVRDASAPPPKPPPPSSIPDIALNLTLDAPGEVYIRGRGLDVELGGRVVFGGTVALPLPQGGLKLRRGTFNLAGQSLALTEGTIDFAGAGLADPELKLVATSGTATVTSTLTISGEVRNPKIVLSSVPELPQDEILSELLFQSVRARLSPFQLAQVAAALASISGLNSGVGDPLESVRTRLGLDELTVGTDASGGATLGAGRYLTRGVRIGATQGASGQSQATVQIDLAKGLKLETTVGTGSSASATASSGTVASSGSGVGLTYEFEY